MLIPPKFYPRAHGYSDKLHLHHPLISDINQIGFVGFTGVFYAMGRAGAGRHQWDVSLLNYVKVNRVRSITWAIRNNADVHLSSSMQRTSDTAL